MRANIAAGRGRLQLSKTAMCKYLSVSGKTYLSYIRGGPIPSTKLAMMADLFGVSCDYLLGRELLNEKVFEKTG